MGVHDLKGGQRRRKLLQAWGGGGIARKERGRHCDEDLQKNRKGNRELSGINRKLKCQKKSCMKEVPGGAEVKSGGPENDEKSKNSKHN